MRRMIDKFIRKLNFRLRTLSLEERKKYLNSYEEIFQEKKENGISESQAMKDIGGVKKVAEEIILTYNEENLMKRPISIFIKYFNKSFVLIDVIILMLSMIIATVIYSHYYSILFYDLNITIKYNIFAMAYIIPINIIINYFMGFYKIEIANNSYSKIIKIFVVNFIMIVIWSIMKGLISSIHISNWFGMILFASNSILGVVLHAIFTVELPREKII